MNRRGKPIVGESVHRREMRLQNRKLTPKQLAKRKKKIGQPLQLPTEPHEHLTIQDALALVDAAEFSERELELPLTAHMTVTWKYMPGFDKLSGASYTKVHMKLVRALRAFLTEQKIELAFVCARENIIGQGGHSHYMIHLPARGWSCRRGKLQTYLHDQMGFTNNNAIEITPNTRGSHGAGSVEDRRRLLHYLLRSMNPQEQHPDIGSPLNYLGLLQKQGAALPEDCKRVVFSENVTQTARKRRGWVDRSSAKQLNTYLEYHRDIIDAQA